MNVLIVGAAGSLGEKILNTLRAETEWRTTEITRTTLTVDGVTTPFNPANRSEWHELFNQAETTPTYVVNAAAMTNVDQCETERESAWNSNVTLVTHLVEECRRNDTMLIQISTDNIFDGQKGPYAETSPPNPINYYGKTKLAAENEIQRHGFRCAILRTMWLYGGNRRQASFVDWVTGALANGDHINVAEDEVGNPTIYDDVAYAVRRVIEKKATGIYNIAGPEIMTRFEIAQQIADRIGAPPELIRPVASVDLGRPALRPLQSGLLTLKAQTELGIRPTQLLNGIETVTAQRMRNQNSRTLLR